MVRLDHPELVGIKLGDIVKFAIKRSKANLKKPVFLFLDELVYAEKWDLWLKTFYDEAWPVQIIASSSSSAALHNKKRESGTGRWEEVYMFPYLLNELLQLKGVKTDVPVKESLLETVEELASSPSLLKWDLEQAFQELIALGGFPESLAEQHNQEQKIVGKIQDLKTSLKRSFNQREKELKRLLTLIDLVKLEEQSTKSLEEKAKAKKQLKKMIETEGEETIKQFQKKLEEYGIDYVMDMEDIDQEGHKHFVQKINQQIKETEQEQKSIRDITSVFFDKTQKTFRSDSIERAIYKDIPQSYRIDNPMILEKFFYILAGQVTGLLSLKNISQKISGVSLPTLERYLSYLRDTYLVFLLPNYAKTESAVQRRGQKIYFLDGAIRNSALLKNKEEIFKNPKELGVGQENLVATHLHSLGKQAGIRIHHYRHKQYEVDFIYDDPKYPLAFEVEHSAKHSYKGLKDFLKQNKRFFGFCYYVAPGINFISAKNSEEGIGRIPLNHLLMAIGVQQEHYLKKYFGFYL